MPIIWKEPGRPPVHDRKIEHFESVSDVWPFLAIADHIISALSVRSGAKYQLTALISIPNQRNFSNTTVKSLSHFGNTHTCKRLYLSEYHRRSPAHAHY